MNITFVHIIYYCAYNLFKENYDDLTKELTKESLKWKDESYDLNVLSNPKDNLEKSKVVIS